MIRRAAIAAALALITPVRRGLTAIEGRLQYAEYHLRTTRGLTPLFVVLVLAVGCAPLQARRAIRRIESRCSAAYEAATTRDEVIAVHARCEAAIEGVRRGD